MKIDKVIFSCDDNPLYKEFWPLTAKVCKLKLGLTPVLLHITDEESELYEDEWGLVKKVKKLKKPWFGGINTAFQSQVVRMWACTLFPDEVLITSDIDMFMINRQYFVDDIADYDDDSLIVFSSDAYQGDMTRIPICYNAAKGNLFKEILKCEDDFETYCRRLWKWSKKWSCDEYYFTAMLKEYNYDKVVLLKRGWGEDEVASRRIDRVCWNYDENNVDHYIDCHSLRPYQEHKEEVDKLVNLLCPPAN